MLDRKCTAKRIAAVVIGFSFLLGNSALAERVEFEMHEYWCERMFDAVTLGGGMCAVDVNPSEMNCTELSYRLSGLTDAGQREAESLISGRGGSLCPQHTTRELMALAQQMRQRTMSYVSAGMDETVCDPARDPREGCNQTSQSVYHLYMCAAHRCK